MVRLRLKHLGWCAALLVAACTLSPVEDLPANGGNNGSGGSLAATGGAQNSDGTGGSTSASGGQGDGDGAAGSDSGPGGESPGGAAGEGGGGP